MVFSWHTFGLLEPIELCLNTTAHLSIVADHVPSLYNHSVSYSDGYFQQDNKAQIISNWFLEHVHFTQTASTVTDLNPLEQL